MPKLLIPHVIEPHSASALIDPKRPSVGQLSFLVGEKDVHHVVMPRSDLEKLAREIGRVLKETPLPAQQE
jgi:hypothetical protein